MILLCDITRSADTIRLSTSDYVDASGNAYRGDIIEEPEFVRELSDVYFGVEQHQAVTVRIADADNGVDDTWREIFAAEEMRGLTISFKRDDGVALFTGIVTEYSIGLECTITANEKDESMNQLLPKDIVSTDAFSTTAIDIGQPVNIIWGYCKNIPLYNIQNYKSDTSTVTSTSSGKLIDSAASFTDADVGRYAYNITTGEIALITAKDSDTQLSIDSDIFTTTGGYYGIRCFDYLIGYGTIESVWEDAANGRGIKRNGTIVDSGEYTFDDGSGSPTDHGYSGYATIRFSKEQVDFSGQYYSLTGDIKGLEVGLGAATRYFPYLFRFMLENSTYGLGVTVYRPSIVESIAQLPVASWMCDYAFTERKQARDHFNDILFACHSRLYRNTDNEWVLSVDKTNSSVASFGENDGYYNNCDVADYRVTSADRAIRTAYLNYDNKQISLACHSSFGENKTFDTPCVTSDTTAKKILSYIYGRAIYADKKISIMAGEDANTITAGDIITVTAPDIGVSSQAVRVIKISRKLIEYNLDCEFYSASIFDDQTITDPTAQAEENTTTGIRTITDAVLKTYSLQINDIGSIGGGTQEIDLSLGRVITATVDTSATTFVFTNFAIAGEYDEWIMILTDAGSQTLTWPASVVWPGGVEPTWTASGVDIVKFFTTDNGGTIHGRALSLDSK